MGAWFSQVAEWFLQTFAGQSISTFVVSMVPVIELRGAIPIGVGTFGLPVWWVYILAVVGNMVPVPFILIFIRRIFEWMRKKSKKLDSLVGKLEKRAHSKGEIVQKYEILGLCILVAIPLPGTGAWTGALVAAILDLRMKRAVPTIFLGVIIAGVAVMLLTYGAKALFSGS